MPKIIFQPLMIANPSKRLTEDRKFSTSPDMSFIPPPGVPHPRQASNTHR